MIQAFLVYNLLLLLLFVTWRLAVPASGRRMTVRRSDFFVLTFVSVVLYTLVLGLRYKVGGDYLGYVDYYKNTSARVSSADVSFEIGFYWLIRTLKFFNLPPTALFLATCGIQMIFMTIWLRRHNFLAHWFIYFYFTTLLVFESLNIIRQAMAFMILLCAMPQLLDRKLLRYLILVGLASTLHASALLFLPLYFLLDREWLFSRRWQVACLLLAYAGANAIKGILFNLLPLLSVVVGFENYASVQEDLFFERGVSGFSAGLIFVLVSDLIIIMASPSLKRWYAAQGFRAYYNAFYIGALLTPVLYFANYITFARLAFYFLAFKFIVLSFLVAWLFSRSVRSLWAKALGAVLVVSYYVWFSVAISRGAAWSAPFLFVFQ